MGMFDSLYVTCPRCKRVVEFQSKVGDCRLAGYTLKNAPLKIIADLEGQTENCKGCGKAVKLRVIHSSAINLEVE